jgi:anti-anti-sigma factor
VRPLTKIRRDAAILIRMVAAASGLAAPFCLESVVSATASLALLVVPDRDVVRVEPRGEIDLASRDVLDEGLRQLWDSGWRHVVLDLSAVSFMDSSALQVLLGHHRRAVGAARRLSIADCSPEVSRVLALTGLDRVLDCGELAQTLPDDA